MNRPALLVAAVLAGCFDPAAPAGVPCADNEACPTGQQCDVISRVCMMPTTVLVWRDDTAADFAQPGATLTDAVVEADGMIAPAPYATGRVRLAALAADTIGADPAAATWQTASTGTRTGRALVPRLALDYGEAIPYGLGLAIGDNVTLLIEGEVLLDATGMWRFLLEANDKGFVDIASPGGDFTRLVSDVNAGTSADYLVATPGWHRIRAAFTDTNLAMAFSLQADSPAITGAYRTITADQLRVRVDDLAGYVVDAFENPYLTDYRGSTLSEIPLDQAFGSNPYAIPVGELGYALRWSGQVRIDVAGDYALRVESAYGHQLWLDGTLVADAAGTAPTTTTAPTSLTPGWHDLVVDMHNDGGTPRVRVVIESGPTWVGQPIPTDHVRPVVGRGVRWTAASAGSLAVADGGSATRTLQLALPPDFVPLSIGTEYEISHPARGTMSVVLDPPVGNNITLLAAGALAGSGTYREYTEVDVASAGGSWGFIASDTAVDAVTGSLAGAAVTIVCSGGIAPFPTAARYESAPRELGDVVAFGPVTWQLRQGTTATVQLRTCDDAAACASEPWTPVARGEVPAVPARRFAQYAVELASDGDTPVALDWFELAYSARP